MCIRDSAYAEALIPLLTANSSFAKERLLRSRNAMMYMRSRNGMSRRNTCLLASSESSKRLAASRLTVLDIVQLLCRDEAAGEAARRRDGISVHVLAAVDLDGRAVDVARPVGEEERDGGRDLLGLADAAERDGRGHGRLAFVGELAAHDLGVDRPGSQDVNGDAEGTQFSRTATAHADDRCLGCRINTLGERPTAIECRDRGGVDDAADAPGDHPLGGCLEHEVGARDVDRHDPLELLELDFVQRYRAGDPGEVDGSPSLTGLPGQTSHALRCQAAAC